MGSIQGGMAALAAVVGAAVLAVPAAPTNASAAPVATAGSHHVRTYPTVAVAQLRRAAPVAAARAAATASPAPLYYQGGIKGFGVVTGKPRVYLVFWGSQWGTESPAGSLHFSNDPAGVAPRLRSLFAGIGTNGELWSTVMTQYCQEVARYATSCPATAPHVQYPTGGALGGVWFDTVNPVSDAPPVTDLAYETARAAEHFGNVSPASNSGAQYMIVSAHGTHPAGWDATSSDWCAWHDSTYGYSALSKYGPLPYTNLPYIPDAGKGCGANFVNGDATGALDGVSIVAGHEYAEVLTDPFEGAGWVSPDGAENADKCAWVVPGRPGGAANVWLNSGTFAMQGSWSNANGRCALPQPQFVDAYVSGSAVGSIVTLVDEPGENNSIHVDGTRFTSDLPFHVHGSGGATCSDGGRTTAGWVLDCPSALNVSVLLTDGTDSFTGIARPMLTVISGSGAKTIDAGSSTATATLLGGVDADHIELLAGRPGSLADGSLGNDYVKDASGSGGNEIDGSPGADTLVAKDGKADVINCGQSRADATQPDAGHDVVYRDAGIDTLRFCGPDTKY